MATFDALRRNGETVEQAIKRMCETYYNFKSHIVYQKYIELCNEQYDLFYNAVNTEHEIFVPPEDFNPLLDTPPPTKRDLAIAAFNKHVYAHGNLMDWLRNNKYGVKNWIDPKINPKCYVNEEELEDCKKRLAKLQKSN